MADLPSERSVPCRIILLCLLAVALLLGLGCSVSGTQPDVSDVWDMPYPVPDFDEQIEKRGWEKAAYLVWAYAEAGAMEKAQEAAQALLAAMREQQAEKSGDYARALILMGHLYDQAGEHAKAVPYLLDATNTFSELLSDHAAEISNLVSPYEGVPLHTQVSLYERAWAMERDANFRYLSADDMYLWNIIQTYMSELCKLALMEDKCTPEMDIYFAAADATLRDIMALFQEQGEVFPGYIKALQTRGLLFEMVGRETAEIESEITALREQALSGEGPVAEQMASHHSTIGISDPARTFDEATEPFIHFDKATQPFIHD